MRTITTTSLLIGFILAMTACGGSESATTAGATETNGASSSNLPVGDKPFPVDPSEFTTEIDNPYWP